MSRPSSVKPVTVTIDRVTHYGTYYVQDSLVYVQYGTARKETQVGGSPAESIAQLLLSELVREWLELRAKGK
jgi:hypothetical protein